METVFRRAVPADARAAAQLLILAWQKAYRGILSDALLDGRSIDEGETRLRKGIETMPEYRYYVLEADGQIVGVSVVCPCMDPDLTDATEIMVFYIHPDHQRQGLGRTLMTHTLAAIRALGAQRVVLWVLRDNRNARAFYKAVGFAPDGGEKVMEHLEGTHAVRYLYRERL